MKKLAENSKKYRDFFNILGSTVDIIMYQNEIYLISIDVNKL